MWRLQYYPNGMTADHIGHWSVYLYCLLPSFIKSLQVKYHIECKETETKFGSDNTHTARNRSWGKERLLTSRAAESFESLTFNIDIKINF